MADKNAFLVKVLPRGEAVDISEFGVELQKICDKVAAGKVKVVADPGSVERSVRSALTGKTFDIAFNAASIENSIRAALTGRTFDINLNPNVQQPTGGGGGGGNNNRNNRNPLGSGDTFSKLVSSQVYLESLIKKHNALPYDSSKRSAYETQINSYASTLAARKTQYASANNVSVNDLNAAIYRTDQYTKAQRASQEAAAKVAEAHQKESESVNAVGAAMSAAQTHIEELNSRKGKLDYLPLMNNLVTGQEEWENKETRWKNPQTGVGDISTEDVGLLGDYAKKLKEIQAYWDHSIGDSATGSRGLLDSQLVEEQAKRIGELKQKFVELKDAEQAVLGEESDFSNKSGKYSNNFFDEFASGIGEKIGWGILAAGAMQARRAMSQVYSNVVELDGALTQISIVTGTSGDALNEFADDAASVAQTIDSTTSAIVSSTETYARLGYNLSDSLQLADITAQYANVAATDVSSATASLTSIMKSFNVAPEDMENVVDMLVKVGQEYAISAGELGEAMQRGGAAMAAGGSSLEETIALFTAGNAAVQDASTVGNAMKTVSARIRSATAELTAMGEEVDDIVKSTSKYRAEIKALSGVDIMEADGTTYRSVYEILKDIAVVYDDLSDINKAQLIEDLAGKRNAQVIASIITNLNDLTGSYEAANNAAGTLATANATYLDSIQGKMNQLSTSYEQLSMNILSSDTIKVAVDGLRGVVNVLNALDDATDGASTLGVELSGILVIGASIFGALKKSEVLEKVTSGITSLGKAIQTMLPLMSSAQVATMGLGTSLATIGGAVVAVTALALAVKGISSILPTFSNAQKKLEETRESISSAESELAEVKSRLEELNAIENPTLADEAEITKLKAENEQLQLKLDLLRDIEAEDERDAEEKFVKKNGNKYKENGRKDDLEDYQTFLNKLSLYESKMETARELREAGDETSAKKWEDSAAATLQRAEEIYQALEGNVSESGITGLTEEGQQILDTVNEMAIRLSQIKGIGSGAASSIRSIFGEFKYSELNDAISQMGSTPEAVASGIQKLWDEITAIGEDGVLTETQEQLKLFIEQILELFDIDYSPGGEAFVELANILLGLGAAAEKAGEQIDAISYDTIDGAKSKVDAINDAMDDFKKYGGLTQDTVDALTSSFPALLDVLYDTDGKLTATGKAALASQDAMMSLAETAMKTAKAINGMSLAEAKAELQRLREELLQTASTAVVATTMIGNARVSIDTPTAYLDGAGSSYDSLVGNKLAQKQREQEIKALESQIADYESMMLEFNNSLKSSFTSSSSSSTDQFKQELEKQLKILKHQLEMEYITYEQYYEGVAQIRDKYRAKDVTKYEEEIWDLEEEIFQGHLTTFQDFVNDYNTIAENRFNSGQVTAARTTYDQILDETKRLIDWGVSYGLSENGDFMQALRKQWKETCQAIMDMINQVYDEYESYADTFDLWGTGAGKVGFSQSDYYEKWLKDLKAAYEKGLIEYEDYVQKHNEIAGKLYDTQRSAIEEIINLTIDMLKQENEDMIDALDEQIDKYQELIELKKKLLQESNDELDHEEEVAELVADIAELQSKIAQLSLDDSREAAAKREELEQELAEKQKELAKLQRDYTLDQTLDALDEEQDAFEKEKENEKDILEDAIDDWMSLYRKAIAMLEDDWDGMYSKLLAYNDKYCTSIDGIDSVKTAWENVDAVVKQLGYDIEAVLNNGSSLGIEPTNPTTGDLVNNVTDEAAVQSIVKQMAANRDAWVAASGDAAEQKRLSEENLKLGNSLANYGLKVVRDEPTGVWYIDHIGGEKLFDRYKYHQGGIVGNKPTNNDREVLALLEKGELVLDEKKKAALSEMFQRIAETANYATAMKFSAKLGNDVSAGDVFAPHVEVNISHNGQMTEEDARRYGDVAADAALEKLRTAFNRRGL